MTINKTVPAILTALKNNICEELDKKSSEEFSIQFIKAIPVKMDLSISIDLSRVYIKWVIRLLDRVRGYASDYNNEAIDMVIELLPLNPDSENFKLKQDILNITLKDAEHNSYYHTTGLAATAIVYVIKAVLLSLTQDNYTRVARYAAKAAKANINDESEIIKQKDDLLELLRELKS